VVDHPDSKPGCFTLKPAYSSRELAEEVNMDHRALLRLLAEDGLYPRIGKNGRRKRIWISDIRNCCPQFMEAWAEVRHQREMATAREAA